MILIYNHLLNHLISWWMTKKDSAIRCAVDLCIIRLRANFQIVDFPSDSSAFGKQTWCECLHFKTTAISIWNSEPEIKVKARYSVSPLMFTWCIFIIIIYLIRTLLYSAIDHSFFKEFFRENSNYRSLWYQSIATSSWIKSIIFYTPIRILYGLYYICYTTCALRCSYDYDFVYPFGALIFLETLYNGISKNAYFSKKGAAKSHRSTYFSRVIIYYNSTIFLKCLCLFFHICVILNCMGLNDIIFARAIYLQ